MKRLENYTETELTNLRRLGELLDIDTKDLTEEERKELARLRAEERKLHKEG